MSQKENQAFQQAPWRLQLQIIGKVLVGFVLAAMVAGVYLNVTARTAAAAIETETLGITRDTLQRQVASLRTEIGIITSAREMKKRADELGFIHSGEENTHYVAIEGYSGKQTEIAAPPITQIELPASILKPSYTQSLWEWLYEQMVDLQLNNNGSLIK